jgi:hypothetical protein
VLARDEVGAGCGGVPEGGVAMVEMVVEVAPRLAGERGRFAAGSVGLDVAAECVLHEVFLPGGTPPLLPACKSNGCSGLAG